MVNNRLWVGTEVHQTVLPFDSIFQITAFVVSKVTFSENKQEEPKYAQKSNQNQSNQINLFLSKRIVYIKSYNYNISNFKNSIDDDRFGIQFLINKL